MRTRAARIATPALAATAMAGGLAFLVTAWIGATNPTFHGDLDSTVEYVNDVAATLALLLTIPGWFAIDRRWGLPRGALPLAIAGQLLLAFGILAGLAMGEDPSWFVAVGLPGNLLWFVATVRAARCHWRKRVLPRWVAIGLALTVPIGMVLGEFGGSLLPALIWAYVGLRAIAPEAAKARPSQAAA
jgi:hypothetical protein